MCNNLVLLGAGGWAREIIAIVKWQDGIKSYCVSDDTTQHKRYLSAGPNRAFVVGTIEDIPFKLNALDTYVVCAVGTPSLKKQFVARCKGLQFASLPIRHPSVEMFDGSLGEGIVICGGTHITTNVHIGNHVGINLNCTVGHDSVIEDYVQLNPGCHISGNVTIKQGAELGTGVNVIPGVTIGEWSVIGAGAVVTKDVPPWTVNVGCPAKPIKDIPHNE